MLKDFSDIRDEKGETWIQRENKERLGKNWSRIDKMTSTRPKIETLQHNNKTIITTETWVLRKKLDRTKLIKKPYANRKRIT